MPLPMDAATGCVHVDDEDVSTSVKVRVRHIIIVTRNAWTAEQAQRLDPHRENSSKSTASRHDHAPSEGHRVQYTNGRRDACVHTGYDNLVVVGTKHSKQTRDWVAQAPYCNLTHPDTQLDNGCHC